MSPIAVQVPYEQLRADAIEARDATIPTAYRLPKSLHPLPKNVTGILTSAGILDDTELGIVNLSAVQVAQAVKEKRYTAVQVTKAFCKAAAIAQQTTNCLTELFEEEALERAKWLDEEYARTGEVVGPMHGVPASIKVSSINTAGDDQAEVRIISISKGMIVLRAFFPFAVD